ncbi:MAG TPA: hypothetical protein PKW37_09215 [Salinivirgaceae bacterium]|nr:hypothetical protein [Salinivirgaceae bacterium]
MSAIKTIKKRLREMSLKKALKKPNERSFINYKDINHVQLLFNRINDAQADIMSRFARFLLDEGKSVEVLIYVDTKKLDPDFQNRKGISYFCRKQLNWYGKPKEEAYINFVSRQSDLMVVADFNNSFHSQWIATLSKAKTIVAPFNECNKWATLLIDTTKNDYNEYLQQVVHYLGIIKTK